MDTETQVYIFVMMAVGAVAAVLLTLLIVKAVGLAKAGDPSLGRNELVERFGRTTPGFRDLPADDQQQIAARVKRHPIVIGYAGALLAGFIWLALGNPALLDTINSGWRVAAIVGIIVLAAIMFGMKFLQSLIAKRMTAQALVARSVQSRQ